VRTDETKGIEISLPPACWSAYFSSFLVAGAGSVSPVSVEGGRWACGGAGALIVTPVLLA